MFRLGSARVAGLPVVAVALSGLLLPSSALATDWIEVGDAGKTPANAQITSGVGALKDLCGDLSSNQDVDIFCIDIVDKMNFDGVTSASYDRQLFPFTMAGVGISLGDNTSGNQGRITGQFVPSNGHYLVAISRYNNDPVNVSNALLWANTPRNVERAPDGPGAATPLDHWNNGGTGASGGYKIDFKGTSFCIPSPSAFGLMAVAGLFGARRRR